MLSGDGSGSSTAGNNQAPGFFDWLTGKARQSSGFNPPTTNSSASTPVLSTSSGSPYADSTSQSQGNAWINAAVKGGNAYGQGSAGGGGLFGGEVTSSSATGPVYVGGFNAPPVPNVPGAPIFSQVASVANNNPTTILLALVAVAAYVAYRVMR